LEVIETALRTPLDIAQDIERRPGLHTYWVRHYFSRHFQAIKRATEAVSDWNADKRPVAVANAPH